MSKPESITRKKLLLAEGKDDYHFFCHACDFYRNDENVQVMDFKGNDKLSSYLSNLINMDGFEEVDTIVIARDAETDAEAATRSIRHSMGQTNMPVPEKPFEYAQNSKMKTAFIIFPGPEKPKGTLEDLCLLTVKDDPLMKCVDDYLKCAKAKGEQLSHIHKNKLHCFLAGKNDYAGQPIGLAFKAKVWSPDHHVLKPFKKIIMEM
ncbi:MAG: hypothetical protein K8R02_01210 [Anaerohalosphaeraceae bacterium]|nr:hypothetical protein [Anaerohalosphaeraceae bacterium]